MKLEYTLINGLSKSSSGTNNIDPNLEYGITLKTQPYTLSGDLVINMPVSEIEDYAFTNCTNLKSITFNELHTPINAERLLADWAPENSTIYVPAYCYNLYNSYWEVGNGIIIECKDDLDKVLFVNFSTTLETIDINGVYTNFSPLSNTETYIDDGGEGIPVINMSSDNITVLIVGEHSIRPKVTITNIKNKILDVISTLNIDCKIIVFNMEISGESQLPMAGLSIANQIDIKDLSDNITFRAYTV